MGDRDPRGVASPAWLVVTARAWRDGDRQIVRLIARDGSDDVRVAVESSSRDAAARLQLWLDDLDASGPRPHHDDTHDDADDGADDGADGDETPR
jgi:hypothetical protein